MKKTHKLKKKVKRVLVKAPPKRKAVPLLESLTEAVLDQLNGGADKATQELRKLTRTKDKTIQSVLAKNAFDTVVGSAFSETRHNEFKNGDAAHQAGESPVREETKTDSEQKESKPMLVAHTEGGSNGTGTIDTNGRAAVDHGLGLNGGTPKSEVLKRFPGLTGMGRRPGQRVVYWNALERNQLTRAIVLELMERGVGQIPTEDDRGGQRVVLDCARAAQIKHMPPDRHRKLDGIHAITNNGIVAALPAMMKTVQAERDAAAAAEAKAKLLGLDHKKPEEPVAPPPVEKPPAPAPAAKQEVPPLSQEELADPILAAANGLIMALRVQYKEMKEIRQMYALMFEDMDGLRARVEASEVHLRGLEKAERKVEGHAKAVLPVVAILGCRKDQFDEIVAQVGQRGLALELRYYDPDSNPRPLNAQWCVMMRFVSHKWSDQIDTSIPRGQSSFVRGGVGLVVQQLELWFNGTQ